MQKSACTLVSVMIISRSQGQCGLRVEQRPQHCFLQFDSMNEMIKLSLIEQAANSANHSSQLRSSLLEACSNIPFMGLFGPTG